MYEKPQYLTSTGFKRAAANPAKAGVSKSDRSGGDGTRKALQEKKKQLLARKRAALKGQKTGQISEKAARLIAEAIKSMLRE